MSNEDKPQPNAQIPHMEKQIMDEPQEEYVADQSTPSKDISDLPKEERPADKR
jgi:hypothetical protein